MTRSIFRAIAVSFAVMALLVSTRPSDAECPQLHQIDACYWLGHCSNATEDTDQARNVHDDAKADTVESDVTSLPKPMAHKPRVFVLKEDVKMEFVLIPAGAFVMGSTQGRDSEKPVHKVTISRPFYLGKYEVTQRQWESLMGCHRHTFKGPEHPVHNVSWHDCQAFLEKMNQTIKADGMQFQLPTEAQWEYACRAGGSCTYCFGDAKKDLGRYAWIADNSANKTHPVGQKKPNAWGLYDMHGNVFEWCQDWFGANYYARSPACDPAGPTCGTTRIIRGGAWSSLPPVCRAAYRPSHFAPKTRASMIGFRVASEAAPQCKLKPKS